jgi:hypothetical protein
VDVLTSEECVKFANNTKNMSFPLGTIYLFCLVTPPQLEYKHVLSKALFFSGEGETGSPAVTDGGLEEGMLNTSVGNDSIYAPTPAGAESSMRFRFVMGVVGMEDRIRFERMIFRVTRGNCYIRFSSIDDLSLVDPKTNKPVERQVCM